MRSKTAICIVAALVLALSTVMTFAQERRQSGDILIERERSAQAPQGEGIEKIQIERRMQEGGMPPPQGPNDFVFLATEMTFGGKLVKGAPYSATAVTESTQTLSDGNRITNKSSAAIYRDSEGRTRREQTLRAIGPFVKSGVGPQTIFISDPVAGTSYTLDPESRIARKMPPLRFKFETKLPPPPDGKTGPAEDKHYRVEVQPDVVFEKKVAEGGIAMGWTAARNENVKTESLGKQNIEGVEAEGNRTTVTIPAGEIGNEREIQIVSERWYSPELQTIVMTRHSDPRFGENTYRLTNISREEPARMLFEVPADYTVKEGPEPLKYRMRKPEPE
jgi:hypothetical protein